MSELLKRLFTSTVLIIILYKAFSNEFVLFFLFILTCFIVLIEFYHLIKKIYINEINKILILFFISIFYLIFCFTQLFFFITGDYDKMLLFIYLLSICIATDLGGYIFGKLFKGKKLTNVLAVSVRYYGGTKLGFGGLIRAYGNSISSVLAKVQLTEYIQYVLVQFQYQYDLRSKVEKVCSNYSDICVQIDHEFTEQITTTIQIPVGCVSYIRESLQDACNGRIYFVI